MKKKTIITLCALSSVLMLSACSETPEEEQSVKPVEPSITSTTTARSETTTEAATIAEPETTTAQKPAETSAEESKAEESSSAEVSSKADESSQSEVEMNGTGGDEEMELYQLYGYWQSQVNDLKLHIEDNNYELIGSETYENGHLEYDDEKDAFLLANNSVEGAKNFYIRRDTLKAGSLTFTEGTANVEFIYMSDLIPGEVGYPDNGQVYDGVPLSYPVNINFEARTDLTDVKLLKLTLTDVAQNGDMYFDTKSLLEVPALAKGQNFAPDVEIPETIPTFGISYRDYHGGEHYFCITQSGMDGSIVMIPFEPAKG